MTKKRGDLKRKDDREGPSVAEIASVIVSVVVTISLFGYVIVMAVLAPDGPDLVVEQTSVITKGDTVEVHVLLTNKGGVGVRSAEVEIPCDDPPPSVTFENVPASGRRKAVLSCPADAEDLQPEISTWVKM
ncbi:MAG: hypothetical protein KY455_09485 [Euryarchaeota archaeon]|nr:hypothetical protein [Euryarchaeota archaeon]